ncbi:MAG: helix-turn-helix domain-containing protein [Planctomycetota bacterium]|nr:helix-turn-helix domain-containing protein [Planctomycetota bacterium]
MAKRRVMLSDQVRQAVDDCGMTRYAIWKATGIDQATLSRFVAGERRLSMDSLDRLADLLDLNITTGRRRRSKGR